jgi:sugar phosphate isomerase/epimerase
MNHKLKELIRRVETWPEEAQEELVRLGLELEAERAAGAYVPTAEELAAIDDADASGVATEAEVESAFARFRRG